MSDHGSAAVGDETAPIVGLPLDHEPRTAALPAAPPPAAAAPAATVPAGWYPVVGGQRYWDGATWTDVDSRTVEDFPGRFQVKRYQLATPATYRFSMPGSDRPRSTTVTQIP